MQLDVIITPLLLVTLVGTDGWLGGQNQAVLVNHV